MIQEPGHNFGMQHSSSMRCGSASFDDTPEGNCTHSEYGDPFDPMGGGCRHMNAWQKTYNGWLQGCNMVRVRSSGTFTLNPLELACDGAQVLQIPMPKTRMFMRSGGGGSATNDALTHYYLELRTKRGADMALTTSVHVRVSGDIRGRSSRGLHTWILDMDPSSTNNLQWSARRTNLHGPGRRRQLHRHRARRKPRHGQRHHDCKRRRTRVHGRHDVVRGAGAGN